MTPAKKRRMIKKMVSAAFKRAAITYLTTTRKNGGKRSPRSKVYKPWSD